MSSCFLVATAVVFLCNGLMSITASSNCEKYSNGNHQYTWNFVLPGGHGIQAKALGDMEVLNTNKTASEPTPTVQHIGTTKIDIHDTVQQKCPECPKNAPGIYWRQWSGKIPEDAIVGGYFVNGSRVVDIYLAQAYLPHRDFAGLQPGQLFNESTSMIAVFKGLHEVTSNVKVLCGFQGDVVWVPYAQTTGLNPETDFVNAGFERTLDLYFAKGEYKGKHFIGKTILQHKLMYLPYEGKESALRSFDVLCYKKSLLEKNIKIPHL